MVASPSGYPSCMTVTGRTLRAAALWLATSLAVPAGAADALPPQPGLDHLRPLAHPGLAIRRGTYLRVVGDGPAYASRRRRNGPWTIWTLPGYQALAAERREGGVVVESRTWTAAGRPRTTVTWADGTQPISITVHTPVERTLDTTGWSVARRGPVLVALPPTPALEPAPDTPPRQIPTDASPPTVTATWLDTPLDLADIDAHTLVVERDCGCFVDDRVAAWLDGRPAVRFRLRWPTLAGERVALLWHVPDGERTFALAVVAPDGDEATLALGRAAAATVHWRPAE